MIVLISGYTKVTSSYRNWIMHWRPSCWQWCVVVNMYWPCLFHLV